MATNPTDDGARFADSWTRRHQPATPPSGRLVQLAEQFLATHGSDETDAAALARAVVGMATKPTAGGAATLAHRLLALHADVDGDPDAHNARFEQIAIALAVAVLNGGK